MKLDKTHLLIAGAALITLASAAGILASLSSKPGQAPQKSALISAKKPAAAAKISAQKNVSSTVIRPSLLGLRGVLPSLIALPNNAISSSKVLSQTPSGASVPLLFAQTIISPSTAIPSPPAALVDDTLVEGNISAISPSPSASGAALPPIPPKRPNDLDAIAQANGLDAPDASAPSTEVLPTLASGLAIPVQSIDAPMPPPRPRDFL
jgi:hypothetical protein